MGMIKDETIKSFSANLGNDMYKVIRNKYKQMQYKNKADFIEKVEKYCEFSVKKIGYVKTLFYDVEPQNLFDFYEPLYVQLEKTRSYRMASKEIENEELISTSSIAGIMKNRDNILFVGHGGCGKTMLLKYLFLNSLQEEYKIPIYVELRLFNNFDGNFIDFLYNTISNLQFEIEKEHFIHTLGFNKYIFLFDAFDEVYPEKVDSLSYEMKSFCNIYPENKYIITSRFSDGFVEWGNFTKFKVCGLTIEQSISLVNKIKVYDEIKKDFVADLKSNLYEKYKSFASSPLLLNIMLITYESTSTLPDKLNGFYEKSFEALFYSHDLSKNRYKRKNKSDLGYEDFKKIFSRVCFISYFKNQYSFNFDELNKLVEDSKRVEKMTGFKNEDYIEDLQHNLCMLVKEGFEYYFTHRSFQEYFAASFIQLKKDSQQIEIFRKLLDKKGNFFSVENFWYIMYELQKERFIENVIVNNLNTLYYSNDKVKAYMLDVFIEFDLGFDDSEGDSEPVVAYTYKSKSKYYSPLKLFEEIVKLEDYTFFKNEDIWLSRDLSKRDDLEKSIIEQFNLDGNQPIPMEELFNNKEIISKWREFGYGKIMQMKIKSYTDWIDSYKEQEKSLDIDIFLDNL